MKFNLYTVSDRVAGGCGPVFQAVNDGVAIRSFRNLMKDVPEHDRDAYVLLTVGTYEDSIPEIEFMLAKPVEIESE